MSRFTDRLYRAAISSDCGMVTGEPDRPCRYTWREVHERARRVAGALASHVGSGARVAILVSDPVHVAPLIQAVWMRGAAFTMIQQPTPRTDMAAWLLETRRVLDMIDAEIMIVGAPFDSMMREMDLPVALVSMSDMLTSSPIEPLPVAEDDIALLQLSSGSTGDPKAVVITHRNLYANITSMLERAGLAADADEVAVSWLPLFHDMGMITFLAMPMMSGIELVSVTPADFLRDPLLWARLIDRYRGTFTGAPDFAYRLLKNRLERVTDDDTFDLSSMRYAINGAEPIDCQSMAEFNTCASRFSWPNTAVVPCYGMAEAVVAVSAPEPLAGLSIDRPVSIQDPNKREDGGGPYAVLGRPLSGVEVRVVDPDTGAQLAECRVGEFELRGDSVTAEYLTNIGAVAAQDSKRWLRTGDLGYLTAAGELVICGRKKDVIIISGRNLYPSDIERAAERVDGVRVGNVAAVSQGAGTSGESFVVLAESAWFGDEERVIQLRRAISIEVFNAIGIPPAMVTVVAPGTLPKTTSGKLRRARVRELILSAR